MYNQVSAECTVLKYKLNNIRDHIERRLTVAEGEAASELKFVLSMITKYEQVPAGWQLDKPLVQKGDQING